MSNAKYIEGNNYVITDKFGRPVEYRVLIDKNVEAAGRDKLNIYKAKNIKDYYDVNGNEVAKIAKNDEGGHMIADSWGGSSDALNIIPQNLQINRGGIWRQTEQCGLEVARDGNKVERIIKLEYPDKNSLRPSEFVLEQKINGSYDVKGGLKPTTITNIFE
jgi:DNA/RNA endonuclease G (NUC1)